MPAPDSAQKKVWRPFAPWYAFVLSLAKLLYSALGGVRRVGWEQVPRSGAVLIAPVHFSTFDPPAVAIACPRQLRFMAKQELFKGVFGWGIKTVGAFPVRRGENDTESVRAAIQMLEDGQAVLVFPEGERGDGVHLGALNPGLAMLAKRTGALVVPTAIVGTHILKPRGAKKLRRTRMVIAFGEPFTFEQASGGAGGSAGRNAFAAELARRLVGLCAENGLSLLTAPEQLNEPPTRTGGHSTPTPIAIHLTASFYLGDSSFIHGER